MSGLLPKPRWTARQVIEDLYSHCPLVCVQELDVGSLNAINAISPQLCRVLTSAGEPLPPSTKTPRYCASLSYTGHFIRSAGAFIASSSFLSLICPLHVMPSESAPGNLPLHAVWLFVEPPCPTHRQREGYRQAPVCSELR